MQGLAQVLTKHKPRLQLETEAAKDAAAAAKLAASKESQLPSYMRPTAAFRHATSDTSSLGENLVVHRSRLERDRDAAKEAAKLASPRQVHLLLRFLPTPGLPATLSRNPAERQSCPHLCLLVLSNQLPSEQIHARTGSALGLAFACQALLCSACIGPIPGI